MTSDIREFRMQSDYPELIQGGMGVGISNWELARAVAQAGGRLNKPVLGVVSGIGLAVTMVNRLRRGDLDTRAALEAFPVLWMAQEIIEEHWLNPDSKLPSKPEILVTGTEKKKAALIRMLVVANFVEVWLAKQGHSSPIGINYLEKIQLTHLPEIFGAMLAGVDYILMGAGIPNQVPGVLDDLADWKETSYRLDVAGGDKFVLPFDPKTLIPEQYRRPLTRPKFLAVVSHHVLAKALATKASGEIDGFVVEGPSAGGHNAPARGKEISASGEPVYGTKDEPDLPTIIALGKPIWLAGGYGTPEKLAEAIRLGATGVQVGSAFALCNESGMLSDIKREIRRQIISGKIRVMANPTVSPSGFPFQVVQLPNTLSDPKLLGDMERKCDHGYMVAAYKMGSGAIAFRCPAEPIGDFVRKGGKVEDTESRVCICKALSATAKDGISAELPYVGKIVTLGKDLSFRDLLLINPDGSYSAEDVIRWVLGG